jgi:acyl dehydratase
MEPVTELGLGLYFDDLHLGQRFRSVGRSIIEADLATFINVTGMQEVLFNNLEYIEHESIQKKRIVPGLMAMGIAEGLILGPTLQKTGIAFLNMTMDIKGAVCVGDTIHVEMEVIELKATSDGKRGLVRTRNQIVNQRGEVVIEYTPLRMQKRRPAA